MLYLPITRRWIVSCTVRRIYFVCALAALSLLGTIFASLMALGISAAGSFAASRSIVAADVCALMAGDYGHSFAMHRNGVLLAQFRQLSLATKTVWFFFLYLRIPVGPAFYYFFVYGCSQAVKECA
jgi:hypothetical protein